MRGRLEKVAKATIVNLRDVCQFKIARLRQVERISFMTSFPLLSQVMAMKLSLIVVLLAFTSIRVSAAVFHPISQSHRSAALDLFSNDDGSFSRYLVKEEDSGRQQLSLRNSSELCNATIVYNMDAQKQDAINVPALWELDSDQHLNVGSRGSNLLEENKRGEIVCCRGKLEEHVVPANNPMAIKAENEQPKNSQRLWTVTRAMQRMKRPRVQRKYSKNSKQWLSKPLCLLETVKLQDIIHSSLLPEDKAKNIQHFQNDDPTTMVEDGNNDALTLATADVGISMGISVGSAIATETGLHYDSGAGAAGKVASSASESVRMMHEYAVSSLIDTAYWSSE
ncbi:putative cadmium/zinc-transporting ATPase HMA4 [Tanacetum coccineum]